MEEVSIVSNLTVKLFFLFYYLRSEKELAPEWELNLLPIDGGLWDHQTTRYKTSQHIVKRHNTALFICHFKASWSAPQCL